MTEEEIRNRGIRCALRHMHSLRVQAVDERTANFAEACSYCEEMPDCKGNWLESTDMISKESRFEENKFKSTEYKKYSCGEKKCSGYKLLTQLTEKDIHCMARIIQSSVFAKGGIFYGCQYCKYWKDGCEKSFEDENGRLHYDVIMKTFEVLQAIDDLATEYYEKIKTDCDTYEDLEKGLRGMSYVDFGRFNTSRDYLVKVMRQKIEKEKSSLHIIKQEEKAVSVDKIAKHMAKILNEI